MSVDGNSKKGSATDYVKGTQLFDTQLKWEYAHLIPYEFSGKKSQHTDNLVITTTSANTEMITIESMIKWLVHHKFPQGVNMDVSANLIPGTQIATYINYSISAGEFSFKHTIHAQNPNKPHISEKDSMSIMKNIFTQMGNSNHESIDLNTNLKLTM